MLVINQFQVAFDEGTQAEVVGRLVIDEEGVVRFEARDQADMDAEAESGGQAPTGERAEHEEVGTPEAE